MKTLIYTFSFLIILLSCKTAEKVKSTTVPNGKRYAIGQGGGITGEYFEFILSENGKVHKYDFKHDREVFFKDLNKVDLHYFLEKIELLSIEGIEMHYPGNMTYYIDVRIGRTSINKITWGSYNYNPDEELVQLHKELFDKLKEWE
ncbi:MAG: hypothetical protein COA97_04320 [Flavobacteriales bacterium]|nr:MAG: hypothetical protein COA97_04320 [Flavobacteriales bacterium]